MNKVLVVGGNGFIGSSIIKLLKEHEDIEVYGTYCSNNDMSKEIKLILVQHMASSKLNAKS